MKKIALILCCVFLFMTLCSCDSDSSSPLDNALKNFTLTENGKEITENFIVEKEISSNGTTYDISWTTNSPYVTVEEQEIFSLVNIDFASVSGRVEVLLVATITDGTAEASKSFRFYISGDDTPSSGSTNSGSMGDTNSSTTKPNTSSTGGTNSSNTKPTSSSTGSNSSSSSGFGDDKPIVGEDTVKATKTTFNNRLDTDGPLTEEAFPSVGRPKMLVIPVNLNNSQKTDKNLQEIKTAFTGTAQETGWESVQSYYYKSSYGKLDMQIEVVNEWFTPSKAASYYNNYYDSYNDEDGSQLILREALNYYNGRYDYNDYDYDKDGFIDGVWLIYNYAVDYVDDQSLFWAFTSWNYEETKYDGVEAYYYAWAGIDFMHQTKEEAGYYDPTDLTVDAHTYIHETGHLMGLDDYYDYDETAGANEYGFYGCDMMDYNIGDHSVVSKLLLGWISPTVVTGKGNITLDLNSFTTTGEAIIIADHELSSIYDTYYTLEFYTNDGLNAHDKPYDSATAPYGIRVMIIRAEKNYVNGQVELNSGTAYQTGFKYDNSDESKMFADGIYQTSSLLGYNDFSLDADCLFQANEVLNKTGLPFQMKVNTMTTTKANITITMK